METQENTTIAEPDFRGGLLPAIAQDCETLEVLMLAWMNMDAYRLTVESGEAHYFSRSRGALWRKGETSGHVQKVRSIRLDCDGDAILLLVEQAGGAACHTGRRSCFYRQLGPGGWSECSPLIFDPSTVYGRKARP